MEKLKHKHKIGGALVTIGKIYGVKLSSEYLTVAVANLSKYEFRIIKEVLDEWILTQPKIPAICELLSMANQILINDNKKTLSLDDLHDKSIIDMSED